MIPKAIFWKCLAASSLAIVLLLGAGCSKKPSHAALELQRYMRQIPQMEEYRLREPLKEWDQTIKGFTDQVKDYEHRVRLLELMKPMKGELRPLHEEYIRANKLKLNAWKVFLGNYDGGDIIQRMERYNSSIAQADSLFAAYYSDLRALCVLREAPIPDNLPSE